MHVYFTKKIQIAKWFCYSPKYHAFASTPCKTIYAEPKRSIEQAKFIFRTTSEAKNVQDVLYCTISIQNVIERDTCSACHSYSNSAWHAFQAFRNIGAHVLDQFLQS